MVERGRDGGGDARQRAVLAEGVPKRPGEAGGGVEDRPDAAGEVRAVEEAIEHDGDRSRGAPSASLSRREAAGARVLEGWPAQQSVAARRGGDLVRGTGVLQLAVSADGRGI